MPIKPLFLKIKNYLQLSIINIKYLINLQALLFIFISLLVLIIGFIVNTGFYYDDYDNYIDSYINSSRLLLIIVLSIFTIAFTSINNDCEINLIISKGRGVSLIVKILSYFILISIISIFVFSIYLFVPSILIQGFYFDYNVVKGLVLIYISLIVLMMAVMLVNEIFNSSFVSVFFTIFYLINIISTQNYIKITKSLNIIEYIMPMPITSGSNIILLHGLSYSIVYLIIEIIILKYYYFNKEFR